MHYLIYSKGTSPTGRALAEKLSIPGGINPPTKPVDLLIRWGSSVSVPTKPKLVLNKKPNIEIATNKMAAMETMRAKGIPIPEIITLDKAHELRGYITKNSPVLGRKLHHTQGRDLILCLQAADVRRILNRGESDYFVVYIQTKREYRIHVFQGKIIRVNQKLLKNGEDWTPFLRNHENGYIYGQPKRELRPEQSKAALDAVAALGLDFGAVDLIMSDDDKSYVLEVNTGPALVDSGLDVYTEAFKNVINSRPTTVPIY